MEPSQIKEISDVLRNPETNNYDSVKAAILKRFGESEEEKLEKLLGTLELGDRSPSQLLREIQRLAGPDTPQAIIRGLWTKRLSPQTRQILLVAENLTLDKQAEMADKIVSVQLPMVASTSSFPIPVPRANAPEVAYTSSASSVTLESLAADVAKLMQQMSQLLDQRSRSQSRGRHVNRSRYSSASPRRNGTPNGTCRFHRKFGDEAYRCIQPCNYKKDQGNLNPQSN
ncbi:Hypothetical protein NTJ_06691 [Nesidiocoris tenuis]|uniref:Uncharacterized protein n=1 Tax=Nesidiocoris tenuis TaxID=355587 RepID=A0ABN7ANS6_9HEMI|nr:Hypothetical protein NTJ_06691 [Nesidiocoris tenuis]